MHIYIFNTILNMSQNTTKLHAIRGREVFMENLRNNAFEFASRSSIKERVNVRNKKIVKKFLILNKNIF